MRTTIAMALLLSATLAAAQEGEKPVPRDSARVTLQGCANGRTFIVGPRSEHASANVQIEPGRRFRLNGPKKVLDEIKSDEDHMVEIVGLVRKADLQPQRGVAIAGGRVRIGGADPRQPVGGVTTAPAYNQITIDVETSRPLPDTCPAK